MRSLSPVEEVFRHTLPDQVPGYELREQQVEMALVVERALRRGDHLLAEAGTGTGKSFAYLVPLALSLADGEDRAVVSTATIALQEQLIKKDIPFLERVLGLDFRAQLAKGKGNYLCLLRLEEEPRQMALFEEQEDLLHLRRWAQQTRTGDRSELDFEPGEWWHRLCPDEACTGRKCLYYRDCFFFKARQRLKDARIIVCNHTLFFIDLSLKWSSNGNAGLLPDYRAVVFDEAQHVEDTARRAMGLEVSSLSLPSILFQLRRREGCNLEAVQMALALNDDFFAKVAAANPGGSSGLLPDDPGLVSRGEELVAAAEQVAVSFSPDLVGDREEALLNCVKNFSRDLRKILTGNDPNRVYWFEKTQTKRRLLVNLYSTPIDVSGELASLLFGSDTISSVIMTSATLSVGGDFSYLKAAVGCPAAEQVVVASPYDYRQNCLLYLPDDLPDPREPDFHTRVAPVIQEILQQSRGRALVLFTSYKGMNETYQVLKANQPWTILRQGERPKQQLLELFREDLHSVLLATASFWEGIDVQGESLSCVIMVKLPFAVPDDPITRARYRVLEQAGGNPFLSFSLPEAVIRLKQGFGRLIRSRSDRGVVAILDPRIRTKWYGRQFLGSLPECRVTSRLDDVEDFFRIDGN